MVSEIFWGFTAGDLRDAVAKICDNNSGKIWVGKDKKCHLSIIDFYEYRLDRLETFSDLSVNVTLTSDQKNRIYSVLQREFLAWRYSHIDLFQLTNFYVIWFSSFLKHRKVKKIWFAYIPHQGAELILYYVALSLKIEIKMFYQSLFKNKAFLIKDIDSLGDIPEEIGPYSKLSEIITFGFPEQDLFYMKNIASPEPHSRWIYRQIKARLKNLLKRKITSFGIESLAHMSYIRKLWISSQQRKVWDVVEFEKLKYVYFPLHLQPELTTDPLGGFFGDQALAIEQLRTKLPSDVAIIVKENPKQSFEWRSKDFFKRIQRLNNVFFVDSNINTYSLLRHAQAVATVTGTAGWEAVIAGKPAIVFGAAWYKKLPGVFNFNDEGFCWNKIVGFEADFTLVEDMLGKLSTHMPDVVADQHYIAIFPEYDSKINTKKLIDILGNK